MIERRRVVMQQWANWLSGPATADVIPLAGRRGDHGHALGPPHHLPRRQPPPAQTLTCSTSFRGIWSAKARTAIARPSGAGMECGSGRTATATVRRRVARRLRSGRVRSGDATILDGELRLARFCPMGFGHLTGQARIAVLLIDGGPFDQFRHGLAAGLRRLRNCFVICFGRSFR